MIKGVPAMFYTSQPEALRAFLRDKLGFPATDVGEGWLIFDLPEAEMGCHPADPGQGAASGTHDISFYCDQDRRGAEGPRRRVHRPDRRPGLRPGDALQDAGGPPRPALPAALHQERGAKVKRFPGSTGAAPFFPQPSGQKIKCRCPLGAR